MTKDRDKVHTRYRLKDGTIVPGVTTVLQVLAKPALIHWAWKMGTEGKDYRKVRDRAADIGTIAHYLIEMEIKGETPDLSDFKPKEVEKAENCYLALLEWRGQSCLQTINCEVQLVSESIGFGGTLDWIADADNGLWLIDVKTGKDIYPEMRYQLAAYRELWNENDAVPIDTCQILLLGKEDGSFRHQIFPELDKEWEIFKHCLEIHKLKKRG